MLFRSICGSDDARPAAPRKIAEVPNFALTLDDLEDEFKLDWACLRLAHPIRNTGDLRDHPERGRRCGSDDERRCGEDTELERGVLERARLGHRGVGPRSQRTPLHCVEVLDCGIGLPDGFAIKRAATVSNFKTQDTSRASPPFRVPNPLETLSTMVFLPASSFILAADAREEFFRSMVGHGLALRLQAIKSLH